MRGIGVFLFCMFLAFNKAHSQASSSKSNDLEYHYSKYFELPREAIYLHLNKSSYVLGEEIWFKGYIYNPRKNLPFKETTNVYVGIYNQDGSEIMKKLFYVSNGHTKGSIKLDSTFKSGTYFIKASTNWMRNFREDNSHIQKIVVHHNQVSHKENKDSRAYDVQFLPEGGYLIAEAVNNVGVKIINEKGQGVKVRNAIIKNKSGEEITTFNTSVFGLGKFTIAPKLNAGYVAHIQFMDGQEKEFLLPISMDKGMGLIVEDNDAERVLVSLYTNEMTMKTIENKSFTMFVHRDGLMQKLKLFFPKNQTYVSLLLKKDDLFKGTNIITVVDENNTPILERLFFNWKDLGTQELDFKTAKKGNDSLEIAFQLNTKNKNLKQLSVSVLPRATLAYGHKDNILSKFYLAPYVKGVIERPSYYFTKITRKKKKELDLVLLTQGWSKYDWNSIFNKAPKSEFVFEQGVQIKGVIKGKLKNEDKVFVHESSNHGSQEVELVNASFNIGKFYPVEREKIHFSLMNKRGKLSKPEMYITIGNKLFEKDMLNVHRYDHVSRNLAESLVEDGPSLSDFIVEDRTVSLNEVVVSAKKIEALAESNTFVPKHLKDRVTEVDKDLAIKYPTIADILRSRGYEVAEELQAFDGSRNAASLESISRVKIRSRRGGGSLFGSGLLLVIDGVRQNNLDVIYQFPTVQIESFYFDKLSRYEGALSQGRETLYLYTRRGKELNLSTGYNTISNTNSFAHEIKGGFELSKEFYVPKYRTYLDDAFMNFGAIHWEPDLKVDDGGKATFKILDTGLGDVSFFIEGMGTDGTLISLRKDLSVSDRP